MFYKLGNTQRILLTISSLDLMQNMDTFGNMFVLIGE